MKGYGYSERIRDAIAGTPWQDADPQVVECWIRLQYGTLDHLDRATFCAEAVLGAQMTIGYPAESSTLAASYGVAV